MTNELLKSAMKINEGVKKYGDVSFTAREVILIIKSLGIKLTEATDAGNKEVLAIVTSYSVTLMELVLEIAEKAKESEEEGNA